MYQRESDTVTELSCFAYETSRFFTFTLSCLQRLGSSFLLIHVCMNMSEYCKSVFINVDVFERNYNKEGNANSYFSR